jgi:formate dehydrogenase major subunit
VPGLGASFGRGAATTFQRDLANSDCVLIMGSNMAEAHPVGFRWPLKAKEAGATLIHVDPRFTRTSALADVFVPIRAGSDIAFLGGIINYIIGNERWFREYVIHYTNAAAMVSADYKDADELGGIFAGFDRESASYEVSGRAWSYTLSGEGSRIESVMIQRDQTLTNPRCVFQILKRHFARYTPEMVAQACGCKPQDVVRVAELLCRNSGRERTSAIVYALGWTQHSTGVQMIRAAGIIQLLLGNVGRPGGGIMAMRGHCSIQGSTDIPTLYHLLPGYLPQPTAMEEHQKLAGYLDIGHVPAISKQGSGAQYQDGTRAGYWANMPKFMVSLLKAWYGDAATPQNQFGYDWIPRVDGDYSQLATFFRMEHGEVRGLFLIGQNPAAGAPNAKLNRAALRKLEWLVVRDWFEHESANFWYADPSIEDPKSIGTEIFLLPAASAPEKDGTLTNTDRLLQWHEKATDPPGDCRSDAWFLYHLGKKLKAMYANSDSPRDAAIKNLTWDYATAGPAKLPDGSFSRILDEPDVELILMEINGYKVKDRTQLKGFEELCDDGSTACGCWIYSGVFPESGRNRARDRDPALNGWLYPNWGFSWPANRRTLYNRASADPAGSPWSERKKLVWWDEASGKWTGYDVPDFAANKRPDYRPMGGEQGMDAIAGSAPFIMHPDGVGWLFAPSGVKDGPLPLHYEPIESPYRNPLYREQRNPSTALYPDALNPMARAADPAYPIVATSYRLTEHYLSGPMSRFNSWLNELQPEMFVELSPELASERGIEHGAWMIVSTPRGEIEARAMITRRMTVLEMEGRRAHQIGLPIHWGYAGETVGAMANDLTSLICDANVSMHEAKAFACQVRAGRIAGSRGHGNPIAAGQITRDPVPDTAEAAQPEGHTRRNR